MQPVCLQLYTVRDAMSADWKGTLKRVADIGYAGVELVYSHDVPVAALRAELEANGLRVSGAHVGVQYLRANLDGVINDIKALGGSYVVCPWIAPDERGDAAAWRAFMHEFEQYGEHCHAAGIQFLYHHHDFELVSLGTTDALTILLDESKTGSINAELDVYWIAFAGKDPVSYLKKYSGRVPCVHLKDMQAGTRTFAEVGHGTLDIPGIIAAADAAGTRWLIVEQDTCPGDPFDSVTKSFQWLKKAGRC